MTEARVHEAGVMHAKLAHERIERHHLGRMRRRNVHSFLRRQNVELIGIEDQPVLVRISYAKRLRDAAEQTARTRAAERVNTEDVIAAQRRMAEARA